MLFKPYRAVGVYSGNAPGIVYFHGGRRYHIAEIPIDNTFHSYKVEGLGIIGLSDAMPEKITQLSHYAPFVSAQAGNEIWIFYNNKVEWKYKSDCVITSHSMFNADLLVILDQSPSLKVYDHKEDTILCDIPLESKYIYNGLLHPPTYENKVLLSTESGHILMFNIKTSKRIFTFSAAGDSKINIMIKTPHLHVIGVGSDDGTFRLINLKKDEILLKLSHSKPIISCDCQKERPIVACGLSDGTISVWDLEEMQLIEQIEAHSAEVNSISYLPGEDSFVTIGIDNSIRVWVENKMLRERFGHALPPAFIDFYGSSEKHTIVSAGLDKTLKLFSPEHESGNRNLGKTTLIHKSNKTEHQMEFIQSFSTSQNRENSWDNLVAVHRDSNKATTWSTYKFKRGRYHFHDGMAKVTCVECSHCGNMVWVGFSNGKIIEYNLQSGNKRKEYIGHDGPIRGLGSQMLQVAVISVGDDCTIRAWATKNGKFLEKMTLPEIPEIFRFQRRTNLAAIGLADYSIYIVDCTDKPLTLARRLSGHNGKITSLYWKNDSRWLISSSVDCQIRTWDVPTGQLVDQFRTSSIPTSIAFSPNDQFLATTHVDELGVYLWSNMDAFDPKPFKPINPSEKAQLVSNLPQMKSVVDYLAEEDRITVETDEYKTPTVIDGCLSVSGLPNSRWLSLINLKLIKSRNKIVEMKAPEKAPFFLPTVAGLAPKFDREKDQENESKVLANSKPLMALITQFGKKMETYSENKEGKMILMGMLKDMTPSKLDGEIGQLDPEGCCSTSPLLGTIQLLTDCLNDGIYWDACQAILKVVLQKHFEAIVEDEDLMCAVLESKTATSKGKERVERQIEESLLLSQFVINNTIAVQE